VGDGPGTGGALGGGHGESWGGVAADLGTTGHGFAAEGPCVVSRLGAVATRPPDDGLSAGSGGD
jgi:hypothetical protein